MARSQRIRGVVQSLGHDVVPLCAAACFLYLVFDPRGGPHTQAVTAMHTFQATVSHRGINLQRRHRAKMRSGGAQVERGEVKDLQQVRKNGNSLALEVSFFLFNEKVNSLIMVVLKETLQKRRKEGPHY